MIPAIDVDLTVPVTIVLGILGVCLLLAFTRLVLGPSLPDRVVALDVIATIGVGIITAYAILNEQPVLVDAAIVLGLIVFLGTVAFARYLERRAHDE